MLTKYFIGINWVDFLMIALVVRMCYIGTKTGVGIELFKLFSLWLVTITAFHVYTTPLSDMLNEKLPALPLDAGDVFVFVALVVSVTLIIRIIRESFFLLIKIEAKSVLDKWGGLAIGLLRGLWICSIGLFIMTISTIQYLEVSAKSSLFGHRLIAMAPTIYKASYEGLIAKFIPGKLNPEPFKAVER
ncbi:MAG: CvpA family protein [Candidatus Omnitrophica bacterium]|nr:CvpA family protein [Candidatus Omnitrophota bacterium]MDD5575018.1 CvpA family protein [Candidatus Omnitrophota bacterium]